MVENARQTPGKSTAQGEASGGAVIFSLPDLHNKEEILETPGRKEVFSLKLLQVSPPPDLDPSRKPVRKLFFFFGLRTTFGVDQSCHLTLPSASIQDKRKTTFQGIIQPKIRILTASITRQKRPFILARIKKVKLVTNLGSQSGLSWKEHKQRHTHAV